MTLKDIIALHISMSVYLVSYVLMHECTDACL